MKINNTTFVFVVGMERCGTHSAANIIKAAANVPAHVAHEEEPFLCKEAKLVHMGLDFRTKDLKDKIRKYRHYAKTCSLVCEANHRLSFLATTLVKEFGHEYSKIVLLVRNPIQTLISRIGTWAHYKDHLNLYPKEFIESMTNEAPQKKPFNEYRISPPKGFKFNSLSDIYTWEWLETYKLTRQSLSVIPRQCRKIMFTEDLTTKFDHLLGFIGFHLFKVNDSVIGWSRTKSDSIYTQEKEKETDVFVTQDRDPDKDSAVRFAKKEINKNKGDIIEKIKTEIEKLPMLDDDLVEIDRKLIHSFSARLL